MLQLSGDMLGDMLSSAEELQGPWCHGVSYGSGKHPCHGGQVKFLPSMTKILLGTKLFWGK